MKGSKSAADGWNNAFLVSAAVSLIGGYSFLGLGSGKNQNYGSMEQPETEEDLVSFDSKDEVFIREKKGSK